MELKQLRFFIDIHIKRRKNNKVLYKIIMSCLNERIINTVALSTAAVVVPIQQLNGYVIENLILLPKYAEPTPSSLR